MKTEAENVVAALCCALLGIHGVYVNGSCVLLIMRITTLKTSFGYLTLYHSLANAFLMSPYVFWIAPCILCNLSSMFELNRYVGQMTIIAQAASYLSMLSLSLNRFVCVFLPTIYGNIYSNKMTIFSIVVISAVCFSYGCVYFKAPCYFIFDRESLEFMFSDSDCGKTLSDYADFWFSISLFALIYFIDISTLIKLRQVIKARNIRFKNLSNNRFKKDLMLFAQTLCTTILFSFTVVCFHCISTCTVSRFSRFCTTTLIWGINHVGAGVIIAVFNKEIRRNILHPLRLQIPDATETVPAHRARATTDNTRTNYLNADAQQNMSLPLLRPD